MKKDTCEALAVAAEAAQKDVGMTGNAWLTLAQFARECAEDAEPAPPAPAPATTEK